MPNTLDSTPPIRWVNYTGIDSPDIFVVAKKTNNNNRQRLKAHQNTTSSPIKDFSDFDLSYIEDHAMMHTIYKSNIQSYYTINEPTTQYKPNIIKIFENQYMVTSLSQYFKIIDNVQFYIQYHDYNDQYNYNGQLYNISDIIDNLIIRKHGNTNNLIAINTINISLTDEKKYIINRYGRIGMTYAESTYTNANRYDIEFQVAID